MLIDFPGMVQSPYIYRPSVLSQRLSTRPVPREISKKQEMKKIRKTSRKIYTFGPQLASPASGTDRIRNICLYGLAGYTSGAHEEKEWTQSEQQQKKKFSRYCVYIFIMERR
jgi:hypothetical protein